MFYFKNYLCKRIGHPHTLEEKASTVHSFVFHLVGVC